MKWHDGKPVTVDDVIFSFEAPAGDKAPMYKPFVTDIAAIEKTGDMSLRFKLKQANTTFLTASLAKINLIPKHIWEPVLKDLAGKPENAEQLKEASPDRLGPVQAGALEAHRGDPARAQFGDHFAAPKMERWIMRIVPNTEATLGMLKRGEINFLGIFGGDAEVLDKFAKDNPDIADHAARSISASSTSPSTTAARRSTTWPSAARCRSPSTAA